jgi:hypothetical protein
MSYNLHWGHGHGNEEQPPPPPPPPTPVELMQMVVESQCMLVDAMSQMANRDDRHVHHDLSQINIVPSRISWI